MTVNSFHTYATPNIKSAKDTQTATSSTASDNGLNPNDFMSLLVAEIQNQDPTNPMDPTSFMTQLVNLNQLEQVTQINQVVQQFSNSSATSATTPTTN
jgi:flagellar basal-body rod modification protein FlgD